MSDEQEFDLLAKLKEQHTQFVAQHNQGQINLQQLAGAIFACENLIKKHEEALMDKKEGDCCDVQVIEQEQEQATQE